MLDKGLIGDVLDMALTTGADFAELFAENCTRTNLQLSSNEIEKAIAGEDFGAGIRIFFGPQSVYAFTNDLSREGLLETAATAAKAAAQDNKSSTQNLQAKTIENRHPTKILPDQIVIKEKADLLFWANDKTRAYHPLISQVQVTYLDEVQEVLIANSEGLLVQDKRVRTRLYIMAVAAKDNEKQIGTMGPGACKGFEFYLDLDIGELGQRAAETALIMIQSDYAPGGKMPVIIDRGFGGVIFHEACGHGLEASAIAKKASIFEDKLGKKIAAPCVSVVDDGTLANYWGSTNIDDEGNSTQRTLLIDKGILKSYMVDRLSGRILGLESTGNGRRQSYKFAPVARMRNTFILPGQYTLDEIIAATEAGLYAKKMGGGSVNPATGDFNFAVMEGYLIEHGRIGRPVRGATLVGNGKDILWNIDMVGKELEMEAGVCGADSGSVPTMVGQPPIRVQGLVVGGRG